MLKNSASRLVSSLNPIRQNASTLVFSERLFSDKSRDESSGKMFTEQQAPYYTAKDIEFCPNRAREVMQNNVEESSLASSKMNSEQKDSTEAKGSITSDDDHEHVEAYQAFSSVSLHSVMQSNVPEPFNTQEKASTHLNMPGSTSSRDYKYLSGKMQVTHQSKQGE